MIQNKQVALKTAESLLQIKEIYGKPDYIAGVATGAIAIGVLVAEYMGVPFIYVRDKAKGHGRQNQVEGFFEPGSNVVVIEDLVSTGGSSLKAVTALKEAGARVLGMLAIFTYDFPVATENFEEAGVRLNTLSDYHHLLEQASTQGAILDEQIELLKDWRKDPSSWGI